MTLDALHQHARDALRVLHCAADNPERGGPTLPRAYHGSLSCPLTAIAARRLAAGGCLPDEHETHFQAIADALGADLPGLAILATTPGVKGHPPLNIPPELAYEPGRLSRLRSALEAIAEWQAGPVVETEGTPEPANARAPRRHTRHSPDFTGVTWHGPKYHFTKTQARAVEILWRAWETGSPAVRGQSIVSELDLGSTRTLSQVFRLRSGKHHEAWGTLIIRVKGIKGAYCLNDPNDAALQVAREIKAKRPSRRTGTRTGKRTGTRKK